MSIGEGLYLALAILAMVAFIVTLASVTYGGKHTARTVRPGARPHNARRQHGPAKAH